METVIRALTNALLSANPKELVLLQSSLDRWAGQYPLSVAGVRKIPFAARVLDAITEACALATGLPDSEDAA